MIAFWIGIDLLQVTCHILNYTSSMNEQALCQAIAPSSSSPLKHSWLRKLPLYGDAYHSLLCSNMQDCSLIACNCLVKVQEKLQGGESGLCRPVELMRERGGLSWFACSRAATSEGAALASQTRYFVICICCLLLFLHCDISFC